MDTVPGDPAGLWGRVVPATHAAETTQTKEMYEKTIFGARELLVRTSIPAAVSFDMYN